MHLQKSQIINLISKTCLDISRDLLRDFNELNFLQTTNKVKEFTQRAVERSIKQIQHSLEHTNIATGFVTNDIIKESKNGLYWLINPIDSIENFSNRLPFFGTVIVLVKNYNHTLKDSDPLKTEAIACAFFDPIKQEIFCAEKSQGAFLNSRKLRVTNSDEMNLIAKSNNDFASKKIVARYFGSNIMHMAYFTARRIDAVYDSIDNFANFIAGKLIVEEANGYITQNGSNFTVNKFKKI